MLGSGLLGGAGYAVLRRRALPPFPPEADRTRKH
jgi:hypothetical protein